MDAATLPPSPIPDAALRLPRADDAPGRMLAYALAAALLLHVIVLAVLLTRPAPQPEYAPPGAAIAVEIVPPSQFAARIPPPAPGAEAVPAQPPPLAAAPVKPTPPPQPEMVHPGIMLSARNLAASGSRQARAALRTLDDDTRIEQLCGLEAMEQVHAWRHDFQPDRLVAYAMGEPRPIAGGIEADGAAFRSRANWYRIRFRCELSPDRRQVVAFAFAVGDPVPRDQWDEHGLPSVH